MKFDQFQISSNNSQQHTTWCANARNMLGPTMLRLVGQQCCERLHGPLTHGIQVVFQCFLVFSSYKTTHSLEFSVRFLAFSRTVNVRKMPENRLSFSVHQLVNA